MKSWEALLSHPRLPRSLRQTIAGRWISISMVQAPFQSATFNATENA